MLSGQKTFMCQKFDKQNLQDSQLIFWDPNLYPKFFGTRIFHDVEFFWNTKFLGPNTFWYTKVWYTNFLWTKIFSRPQYFGTRNFFEPIILSIRVCIVYFWSPKFFGTQIFQDVEFFWNTKFLGPNTSKNFRDPNILELEIFLNQ